MNCDTGLNLVSVLFNKIIRRYSVIFSLLLQHYHEKEVFVFKPLYNQYFLWVTRSLPECKYVNVLCYLILPQHSCIIQGQLEWNEIKMSSLRMRYLLSESQYGKILSCVFHRRLYFGFLNLIPWLTFILILRRVKLASCCDAVQNFIVSQNNTPVGTNMSYEVESKSEIQIRENIFDMLPVVSENFLWFVSPFKVNLGSD